MIRRTFQLSLAVATLTCLAARAQDIPDSSPNAVRFPAAVAAGAPPKIPAGTRLTYAGTNATVSGRRVRLALDNAGNWVEKESAKRWETGNSGGVGYTVVRVGHIDDKVAAVSTSAYLLDLGTNTVGASANEGFVSESGCGGAWWVHPEALAALEDSKADGELVLRMPYVVSGRKYNAIRLTTESPKHYTAQVFDLDTGLLIFYAAASVSDPALTRLPDGQVVKTEGSTHTATATLLEAAHVPVPWAEHKAPKWKQTFEAIEYEGSVGAVIGGTEYSQATSATVVPVARGTGWLRFALNSVVQNPGLPPSEGRGQFAAGNASVGGLWVPTKGLAELREGQEIETNAFTRTRTAVTRVGGGSVTISEVGPAHRVDTTYDLKTGIMTEIVVSQETVTGRRTNRLRLKERR